MLPSDIINICRQLPNDGDFYLVSAITSSAGFFCCNNQLLYLASELEHLQYESIETEYLSLQMNVFIQPFENNASFDDGYYNIISFKGDIYGTDICSFIELCHCFSISNSGMTFKSFFYSLISLFKLKNEQKLKNAIGLYGELKFLQYSFLNHNVDISSCWHKSGSTSKFDFSGKNNFEVKCTTSSEQQITIKHSQIFGGESCILVVVCCEKTDEGETISELIKQIHAQINSTNNISFCITLMKELSRISAGDADNIEFSLKSIQLFDATQINPFEELPDGVSNLNYSLDLFACHPLNNLQENIIFSETKINIDKEL